MFATNSIINYVINSITKSIINYITNCGANSINKGAGATASNTSSSIAFITFITLTNTTTTTTTIGRLHGLAVECWSTDHYHPCSNLGVGISEGCFIFHHHRLLLKLFF